MPLAPRVYAAKMMEATNMGPMQAMVAGIADPNEVGYNQDRLGRDKQMYGKEGQGGGLEDVVYLNHKLGEEVVLDEHSNQLQIVTQTKFQRDVFEENASKGNATHTDLTYNAAKDFYKCVTSVYDEVIGKTVPILITYQRGLSTDMYVGHFKALFKLHPKVFGLDHHRNDVGSLEALTTLIVDHSDAQRKAIYRAMGLILLEMSGDTFDPAMKDHATFVKSLNKRADEIGEKALEKYLKGCDFHLEQSIQKLMSNARFIPVNKRSAFRAQINIWKQTGVEAEFKAAEKKMKRMASGATDWIAWWSNPIHAKLIFPAYAPMGKEAFDLAETTNNRSETNNRDMQRCSRGNLGIADAIETDFRVRTNSYYDKYLALPLK
jgi:hypothetical protein